MRRDKTKATFQREVQQQLCGKLILNCLWPGGVYTPHTQIHIHTKNKHTQQHTYA